MAVTILQPHALHEIGKRGNNEDAIFPPKDHANAHHRLFLVCDGVGGNNKGEVASHLLSHTFAQYFTTAIANHQQPSAALIQAGMIEAEEAMMEHIANHPSSEGMASTFTMVYLFDNQALIAWVGDSRIYHIRPSKGILYRSTDHSIVQELLNAGELTEAEARVHPQRNVLLKAVTGDKPVKADVKIISDIKNGDYFFLCSDGILEGINDEELAAALSKSQKSNEWNKQFTKELEGICLQKSKDNYSMYLVQIESLSEENVLATMPIAKGTKNVSAINEQTISEKTTSELDAAIVQKAERRAEEMNNSMDTASYDELVEEEKLVYEARSQKVNTDSPSGEVAKSTLGWMKWLMPLLLLGAVLVGLGLGYFIFGRTDKEPTKKVLTKMPSSSTDSTKNTKGLQELEPSRENTSVVVVDSSEVAKTTKDATKTEALEESQFQEHLDNGEEAIKKGDYKAALTEYNQALEIAKEQGLDATVAQKGLDEVDELMKSGKEAIKKQLKKKGVDLNKNKLQEEEKPINKKGVDVKKEQVNKDAEKPIQKENASTTDSVDTEIKPAATKETEKLPETKLGYSGYLKKGRKALSQKKYQEALDLFTKAQKEKNTPFIRKMINQCKEALTKKTK